MHPSALGALINSALLLSGLFVAGLMAGNRAAWMMALASAATAFVMYVADMLARHQPHVLTVFLMLASWMWAIASALQLLFG